MTTMSDLSVDLVGEILSRVPLTSLSAVRCTCKSWNTLSKHQIFGKAELAATKQFLGFTVMDYKVCSLRFDLQGIRNDGDDFVDHGKSGLKIRNKAVKKNHGNGLHRKTGRCHIVERSELNQVEVYDVFHSDGLLLCVTKDHWRLVHVHNTQKSMILTPVHGGWLRSIPSAERFGPHLPLPVHSYDDVTLSCVRQEQLALLYGNNETDDSLEIWITNQIDPNAVSWSIFLKVDIKPLIGFPKDFDPGSFFIDEEKKVVVVYDLDGHLYSTKKNCAYQRLYIIGEDGYFTSVKIKCSDSPEFSAYAPSLVTYKPTNYAK
ncbi:F-box associated ubiquitination effector family protein [Arabidopsis thaliana]|uniref:F-box associated ubiquitination effector family protein n=1 Tax=Arabidopsis thaliana TaxID=3702 RepID=A0A1P8AWI0_ARATH|nr:F-box associated ubiquitination effector family protein [Arabidopsis thaliana]ANM61014.1 F-box associated ubiquitination effector family protein [Arabidopsis thaliana]|eukprot:NP_001323259.1 F-box associated ubiquitination effector family protein [Arabidopsis thaliana]